MLAIDLDVFNVGSTPLQMLLVVLVLTVIVALVIMLVTQVFSPYLNRRWPATVPLSPTELLWGEAGGHVKRTFRGLDLEEQKDVASQLDRTQGSRRRANHEPRRCCHRVLPAEERHRRGCAGRRDRE